MPPESSPTASTFTMHHRDQEEIANRVCKIPSKDHLEMKTMGIERGVNQVKKRKEEPQNFDQVWDKSSKAT